MDQCMRVRFSLMWMYGGKGLEELQLSETVDTPTGLKRVQMAPTFMPGMGPTNKTQQKRILNFIYFSTGGQLHLSVSFYVCHNDQLFASVVCNGVHRLSWAICCSLLLNVPIFSAHSSAKNEGLCSLQATWVAKDNLFLNRLLSLESQACLSCSFSNTAP